LQIATRTTKLRRLIAAGAERPAEIPTEKENPMTGSKLELAVALALAGTLSLLGAAPAAAAESTPSALTCDDFRPTPEALERFPDLQGACEEVVERNGELYAKFVAVVRRARNQSVTLYLPATDHTFTVTPDSSARVLLGGRRARVGDLTRGQEIRIYLATSEFAKPDIEEVALVSEEAMLMVLPVVETPTLPTTASLWPALGVAGAASLGLGLWLRRARRAMIEGGASA
jgi:hypothetical protein